MALQYGENLVDNYKKEASEDVFEEIKEEVPQYSVKELEKIYNNKEELLPFQDREEIEEYSKIQLKLLIGLMIGEPKKFVTEDISIREQYLRIVEELSDNLN